MANDFLNINNFTVSVAKIPSLVFSCQTIDFPGLSLGSTEQPSIYLPVPTPGDRVVFDDLSFTFLVDEDMSNFIAIRDWIIGLAFPESFDQYNDFIEGTPDNESIVNTFSGKYKRLNEKSDITVQIYSNHKNPLLTFIFRDAYPLNLGSIPMQVTNSTSEVIPCSCTFKYRDFIIQK